MITCLKHGNIDDFTCCGKCCSEQDAQIASLKEENERLVYLNANNSHEYNDKCPCGFCYAMRQHKLIYEKLGEKLKAENLRLREALKEIQEMFDGEADIDNNGNPNRAMTLDVIINRVLTNE